jgi:hypothetical protein
LFSSCWACLYYAQLICNKGLWRDQVVVNSSIELSLRQESTSAKASWCWAALTRRRRCFIKMLAGIFFPLRRRKMTWCQLLIIA